MGLQTSVDFDFAKAVPGQVVEAISTRARAAEVAITAGLFVVQGTLDGQCKLPTSSGDVAKGMGIAVYFPALDSQFPSGGTPGATYQIGDALDAVSGKVWVAVEEAVSAMDPVYVRYATGSGTQKGAFRKSADSSTAAALTGGRYLTSASAGGMALAEINIPQ